MSSLQELMEGMDIPDFRRENLDLGWLSRNLPARNREHPNFDEEAMNEIKTQLREWGNA